MEDKHLIPLHHLYQHYQIERDFVHSLSEFGIVEIIVAENEECISEENLAEVEKMMHLHYDLDINVAGLDAISHLLRRVREMQHELTRLRNKLNSI